MKRFALGIALGAALAYGCGGCVMLNTPAVSIVSIGGVPARACMMREGRESPRGGRDGRTLVVVECYEIGRRNDARNGLQLFPALGSR